VVVIVFLNSNRKKWRRRKYESPVDVVVVGMQICKIVNSESSFRTGSCSKCAGLSFGSCKKLEVAIAGLLFVNRIVLFGIFGLQETCTPKTNALQLVM
jgi:hypothetical protein